MSLIKDFTRVVFFAEWVKMVSLERGEDLADKVSAKKYVPKARFAPNRRRTVVLTKPRSVAQVEYHDHSYHPQQCECMECRAYVPMTFTNPTKATIAVEGGVEVKSADVSRRTIQNWEKMDKAELAEFHLATRRREMGYISPEKLAEVVSSDMIHGDIEDIEAGFDRLEEARLQDVFLRWFYFGKYVKPKMRSENRASYTKVVVDGSATHVFKKYRGFSRSETKMLKELKAQPLLRTAYRRPKGRVGARSTESASVNWASPVDKTWLSKFITFIRDWHYEDDAEGLLAKLFDGDLDFYLAEQHFNPKKVVTIRDLIMRGGDDLVEELFAEYRGSPSFWEDLYYDEIYAEVQEQQRLLAESEYPVWMEELDFPYPLQNPLTHEEVKNRRKVA